MGATYELPIGTGKLVNVQSGVWNSIIGGFKINASLLVSRLGVHCTSPATWLPPGSQSLRPSRDNR